MARIWTSGFESNSTTADVEFSTISGTASLVTTTVRSGTYALRVNPSASTGFIRKELYTTDQAILGYQRIYINIASLPSATTGVCRFVTSGNTNAAGLRLTSAGIVQLVNSASVQVGSNSSALNTGQWYMLEIKSDATTSPGTLEARLDGSVFASGSNDAQGSWSRAQVGSMTSSITTDLYFDDWAMNDASGSFQNSYPGSGKVIQLVPNAAGDNTQWTIGGTSPPATNWEAVDDVPPNDGTDIVRSTALNDEDFYNVTNSGIGANDTVNVVHVGGRFSNDVADATTAFKFEVKKASGGTVAESAAIVPNTAAWRTHAPAAPFLYPITLYQDPDTSNWTQSTLDSMQIGYKLTAMGTNNMRVSAAWALVDYTPVAAPSAVGGATLSMMGV